MIRPNSSVGEAMMRLVSAYTNFKDPLGPGVAIQRKGAVKDFFVEPGNASCEVYDGRDRAFDVEIHVSPPSENIRRAVKSGDIENAVPKVGEIQVHHVCPEWANPCRHEIAAFLQLVKEVDEDENTLLKWRGLATEKKKEVETHTEHQSLTEPDKKATIRALRNNLPGRFVNIQDPKESKSVDTNQEVIDFLSFPKESPTGIEYEKISETNKQENIERAMMFNEFDAKPVFIDALETIQEFLLKN